MKTKSEQETFEYIEEFLDITQKLYVINLSIKFKIFIGYLSYWLFMYVNIYNNIINIYIYTYMKIWNIYNNIFRWIIIKIVINKY